MKRLFVFLIIMTLFSSMCMKMVYASSSPNYIYNEVNRKLPFSISHDELKAIDSPKKARIVFLDAVNTLKDKDKHEPYIVDALTLLAEECIRYSGQENFNDVQLDMLDIAKQNGIEFLRKLRYGTEIDYDEINSTNSKGINISITSVEHLYLNTPYATVRLNAKDARYLDKISIKQLGDLQEAEKLSIASMFLKFWSIWIVMLIIIISILIESFRKNKMTRWLTLCLSIILYSINFGSVGFSPSKEVSTTKKEGIEIKLAENMKVILSIPIQGEKNNDMIVVDDKGNIVPCRYNPITNKIDAKISNSSIYILKPIEVSFIDINDKNTEMQDAIEVLISRGLMEGADERSFLPDRPITRAEFLSVVLRMMDLLDKNAECKFNDVIRSDWFYPIAASASKEGLITGYKDGTFRANDTISKVEMINIISNLLVKRMAYTEIRDCKDILEVYEDKEKIDNWAVQSVALATKAGILPMRIDRMFDGTSSMTRGDVAVILYRLFNKIW